MKHYKERPCPGECGRAGRWGPQVLCPDCHRLLKLGRKRAKEVAELNASGEKIKVTIGSRFIYSTGAHLSFLPISDISLLRALVRLGGLEDAYGSSGVSYKEARSVYYEYRTSYRNRPRIFVWATTKQADDVELILDYIRLVIEKAYEDGQINGRSLIRRLVTAGTKELNEMTIAGDKK